MAPNGVSCHFGGSIRFDLVSFWRLKSQNLKLGMKWLRPTLPVFS
jgi:hypothetical protein